MKKLGFLVLSLGFTGLLFAAPLEQRVWQSSWTNTTDTTKNLCVNQRGILHSIIIGSGTVTNGGALIIYASSGTVDSTMTYISGSTVYPTNGNYVYDVMAKSTNTVGSYPNTGLTYSNTAGMSVTIMYDCYPVRP